MNFNQIKELIVNDIKTNNDFIIKELTSNVILINQISNYIINSGGKRIRPIMIILIARALGYEGINHYKVATFIEFIHTATLLHDDVVDNSDLRRGQKTANNIFGNAASILTGDFLYSRAFQIMVSLNNLQIMKIMADATNKISEGEVMQLMNCHNANLTEQEYMQTIYCKTAKLFESAAQISAIIANASDKCIYNLGNYAKKLGQIFQIADDILDYTADSGTLGKNIGDDLAEGKVTLPMIYALQNTTKENKDILKSAIKQGNTNNINKIIKIIKESGAIEYSENIAYNLVNQAISDLDVVAESKYKDALISLLNIALKRKY